MSHTTFVTTQRGLDRATPPMRLFEKAKRFGVWNPSDIDMTQDKQDWAALAPEEKDLLLRLTAMFQAGEEAVTLDLLPLIMTIAEEGRLEEEMFLTTFLFEEAKHTDFFSRVLNEVIVDADAETAVLDRYHTDNYHLVFYDALPQALQALQSDRSPEAQIRASVTYNMIVEGILAETGYHAYFTVLEEQGLMPGVREGIRLLKQDESRHIAYGIYLISRLVAENKALWPVVEDTMNELLMPALGVVGDTFTAYDPMPFGLEESVFVDYATSQFQKRLERLEKAREATLDDVIRVTHRVIDTEDS